MAGFVDRYPNYGREGHSGTDFTAGSGDFDYHDSSQGTGVLDLPGGRGAFGTHNQGTIRRQDELDHGRRGGISRDHLYTDETHGRTNTDEAFGGGAAFGEHDFDDDDEGFGSGQNPGVGYGQDNNGISLVTPRIPGRSRFLEGESVLPPVSGGTPSPDYNPDYEYYYEEIPNGDASDTYYYEDFELVRRKRQHRKRQHLLSNNTSKTRNHVRRKLQHRPNQLNITANINSQIAETTTPMTNEVHFQSSPVQLNRLPEPSSHQQNSTQQITHKLYDKSRLRNKHRNYARKLNRKRLRPGPPVIPSSRHRNTNSSNPVRGTLRKGYPRLQTLQKLAKKWRAKKQELLKAKAESTTEDLTWI